MTVVDIEEEKENSSGLIYILQTKRLARVLRENRSVEEPWEVEVDDEEEEEEDGRRRNLKSTFHSVGLGGEMTSVDTSVTTSVTTVLHNIPLSLQMTEIKLGSLPLHTQCPHCTFFIVTKTEPEVGLAACLCSSLLCCLSCCLCSLLPCYLHVFTDVAHYCPQCYQHLGTYKRLC